MPAVTPVWPDLRAFQSCSSATSGRNLAALPVMHRAARGTAEDEITRLEREQNEKTRDAEKRIKRTEKRERKKGGWSRESLKDLEEGRKKKGRKERRRKLQAKGE